MILLDLANEDHDCQINGWSWRPTIELIRSAGLLGDEQLNRMSASACGGRVSADEAAAIARFLEENPLPRLNCDERIHADGTVSKIPSAPRLISQTDSRELYAARKDCLEKLVAFRKACGGIKVL